MRIEWSQIPAEGMTLKGESPPSVLDLEGDRFIRCKEPVTHEFFVQLLPEELVVRGRLEAELEVACVRCAEFFSTTVTDSSFLRAYDIAEAVEVIDLSEDIRDTVLLGIPQFPVCKSDCRGLCPQCGKNLNDGPCDCPPLREEGRWDALDRLNL